MPVKESARLQIKVKKGSKGARGTEQADQLIDLLSENWQQIQDAFKAKSDDEQEALLEHFESINEDLGDCLFGEEASAEDVSKFINGKPDEEQDAIAQAINDALNVKEEEENA